MNDEFDVPSDYRLEQLALEEAPPLLVERLGAHLVEGEIRERVEGLRRGNAEILAAHPPARVLEIVRARTRTARESARTPRRRMWWAAVPALAASAAVLAVFVRSPEGAVGIDEVLVPESDPPTSPGVVVPDRDPPPDAPPGPSGDPPGEQPQDTPHVPVERPFVHPDSPRTGGDDDIRVKGQRAHLVIHRRERDTVVRLRAGDEVRPGDLLQLAYAGAGRSHGVILSLDGAGAVTLHFPEAIDGATALRGGRVVALGHAYELDEAPEFERFVFVTSDAPIDVEATVLAAEHLAKNPSRAHARTRKLSLPRGTEQVSMLLRKVES